MISSRELPLYRAAAALDPLCTGPAIGLALGTDVYAQAMIEGESDWRDDGRLKLPRSKKREG